MPVCLVNAALVSSSAFLSDAAAKIGQRLLLRGCDRWTERRDGERRCKADDSGEMPAHDGSPATTPSRVPRCDACVSREGPPRDHRSGRGTARAQRAVVMDRDYQRLRRAVKSTAACGGRARSASSAPTPVAANEPAQGVDRTPFSSALRAAPANTHTEVQHGDVAEVSMQCRLSESAAAPLLSPHGRGSGKFRGLTPCKGK